MEDKNKSRNFVQMRSRAAIRASTRALAAGYLVYLSYQIVRDAYRGESGGMQPWVAWAVAAVFCAVAAAFGLYAWKVYKTDMKAAEPTAEEKAALDAAAEAEEEEESDQ